MGFLQHLYSLDGKVKGWLLEDGLTNLSGCFLTVDWGYWRGWDIRLLSFCRIALPCSHSSWESFQEKQWMHTRPLNWHTINSAAFYWPNKVPSLIQIQRARYRLYSLKLLIHPAKGLTTGMNGELWPLLQYLPLRDSSTWALKSIFSLGRWAHFLIVKCSWLKDELDVN